MNEYNYTNYAGDFDGQSNGITYPFARIRQKPLMSEDGDSVVSPAGTFMFTDDRESGKELLFLMLFSKKGRVKWDSPDDEKPSCRSINGDFPMQNIFANTCRECPHSVWGKNGVKPACDETLSFLCLDTDMNPFIMQFKGTGVKPARDFVQAILSKANKDGLAPWHYAVELKTKKIDKSSYTYYLPVFPDNFVALEEDQRVQIDEIREGLKDEWERVVKNYGTDALPAGQSAPALPPTGVVFPPNEDDEAIVVEVTEVVENVGNPFKKRSE